MPFALVFETDTAAFEEGDRLEQVATILMHVSDDVEAGQTEGRVRDANGTTVGSWYYGPDRNHDLVPVSYVPQGMFARTPADNHPAGGNR